METYRRQLSKPAVRLDNGGEAWKEGPRLGYKAGIIPCTILHQQTRSLQSFSLSSRPNNQVLPSCISLPASSLPSSAWLTPYPRPSLTRNLMSTTTRVMRPTLHLASTSTLLPISRTRTNKTMLPLRLRRSHNI